MKKIYLLLSLLITLFTAAAQPQKYGNDNSQGKGTQVSSLLLPTDPSIENISVYPNPVVDELRVTFKSSQRCQATLSIFNNIGKQVYTHESTIDPGNNIFVLDIRSKSIEPGVYFIQLKFENQTFTRKLIVK